MFRLPNVDCTKGSECSETLSVLPADGGESRHVVGDMHLREAARYGVAVRVPLQYANESALSFLSSPEASCGHGRYCRAG